jgi:hypothetical protein
MLRLFNYAVQPMMDTATDVGGGGQDTTATDTQAATEPVADTTDSTSLEIEIDGIGKVKAEDIKEWKLGYMRQSDYTKKTQEIARQRSEAKDAMEIYNYLKQNPQIAQALADGDAGALKGTPIAGKIAKNPQLEDVNYRLATIELDAKLTALKSKYPDFNEVEVLTEADRLGVSDLEFVYNAIRGKKVDEMKEALTKQIKNELTEKIRKNGIETQTIISPNDTTPSDNYGLTPAQIAIATKMNLTPEQYAKGVLK